MSRYRLPPEGAEYHPVDAYPNGLSDPRSGEDILKRARVAARALEGSVYVDIDGVVAFLTLSADPRRPDTIRYDRRRSDGALDIKYNGYYAAEKIDDVGNGT